LVEEYAEIPSMLEELYARHLRRSVLVSGAAVDFAPFGPERLEQLCRQVGHRLVEDDYDVVSGFGLGVGGPVILGAIENLYRLREVNIQRRLKLFPFPQEEPAGMTREDFYARYRADMISNAGFVVVIAGNRDRGSGLEPSPGVREEVAIARQQGKYVIPIGATGWVAKDVWEELRADFGNIYPTGTPRDSFDALGDETKSNDELLGAMMRLIRFLTPRPI
jgi:hypothetical protein